MILVTLGTQIQSFARLLEYIENSSINEEIIVQAGKTKFESQRMKMLEYIEYDEMEKLIDNASMIVTHGGTGSIVMALKKNKQIIACARKQKYGEHVDDHQEQIVDLFAEIGHILKLDENVLFDDLYETAKTFEPKEFVSNNKKFLEKLKECIDE